MTDPSPARRAHTGFPALLLSLLATAALALAITPAAAAAPVKGKATLTLGSGKAGKALKKQRVKLVRVAPAKVKRLKGKRFRVNLPARSVNGKAGRAALKGGLKFKRGKRALPARNLVVAVKGRTVRVTAKLGGSKVKLFAGKGKTSKVNGDVVRVKVSGAKLKLTGKASKMIKRKLKLKRKVPAAAYGKIQLNASRGVTPGPIPDPDPDPDPDPSTDPYLEQCGLAVTTKVTGSLPAASPLPDMVGAKPLAASTPDIKWGFKASFRGYMGGTGSLHAVSGAGRDGAGPIAGFTFPAEDGQYLVNDPADTSDDQAVINGKGAAVFCNPGHGFGVAIANPTIVIDGTDTRIVADVDTNYFGTWTPAQRVDLAELDLDGISPFYNRSGTEITWQNIPAKLTASGAEAFCEPASDERPGQCLYSEGDELDPITAVAHTAYDTGAGDAAAWDQLAVYTKTNLHFPLPDRNLGGCEMPDAAGGNTSQARTIDEYLGYNAAAATPADPPAFLWVADGDKPGARPDLAGGTEVTGGGLDWGVISGLRSSNNANGEFNLYGGATASDTYYGVGGTESAPPIPGYGQKLGAPTAFFTWPAADVAGAYRQDGADRKLVLQTKGRVAICNTKLVNPFWMGYGTVISNPTVVIDGADSRITADVATRYRLSWVRGTVDIARFNTADATVNESTTGGVTTVEWALPAGTDGKTKMTESGSTVLRMLSTNYVDGSNMQNPTVRVSFPEN